jgi:hypothetical protein
MTTSALLRHGVAPVVVHSIQDDGEDDRGDEQFADDCGV